MEMIVAVICSLFVGMAVGAVGITLIRKKKYGSKKSDLSKENESADKLIESVEKTMKTAEKVREQLDGLSESIKENYGETEKIDVELGNIITNHQQKSSEQAVSHQQTEEQPEKYSEQLQASQSAQPRKNIMEDIFRRVERMRTEAPAYRVYNPNTNRLEYSSDVNSKYIILPLDDTRIIVLPNQVDIFHKKQVSERIYKCSADFIEPQHQISFCIADSSRNIIKSGEIFA